MFGLIRRISHSVIPRPDRPWADDPTSNAPQKGRKRRLSSTERDLDPDMEQSNAKKVRGESVASSVTEVAYDGVIPLPQIDTEGVKEVTAGVREVELADVPAPESIPLPAEEGDELEEPSSTATPPPDPEAKFEDVAGETELEPADKVSKSDFEVESEDGAPIPAKSAIPVEEEQATEMTEGAAIETGESLTNVTTLRKTDRRKTKEDPSKA